MMNLTIIKPDQIVEHEIIWLEVVTDQGSFVIQTEHAPMVLVLAPGKPFTFCLENGTQESMLVTCGVVEVSRIAILALLSDAS